MFIVVGMFLTLGISCSGDVSRLGDVSRNGDVSRSGDVSRLGDEESQSQRSKDRLTSLRKVVGMCTAVEMGNKTLSSSHFASGTRKSPALVVILHVVKKARPRFSTVERVPGTYSQTEYRKIHILVFGDGCDSECPWAAAICDSGWI